MHDAFQEIVLRLALPGFVAALVALPVCAAFPRLRTQCRALNAWSGTLVASVLLVAVRVGGTKTNGIDNLPPQPMMTPPALQPLRFLPAQNGPVHLADPAQASRAAAYAADWNVCGAWKDSFWLPFAEGWVFPWGTNHLCGVEVVSYGQLWATPFDTNAVASAGAPFEIVPGLTSFAYEHTPSNSYRFVWTDAAIGRDTNDLVTAVLELFRNGDRSVTTNGIAALLPRALPFAHDGYGQDDAWVTANFTNATEILSVGYTNWVAQTVGENVANGLFCLKAVFEEDPPETCLLRAGNYAVAVRTAGTCLFVLPVFDEHALCCWPYPERVRYEIDDGYTGTGVSYRVRYTPADDSADILLRRRLRMRAAPENLGNGTFAVEPLVVTDPPAIPYVLAENATVSAFWNVSGEIAANWSDQQGNVTFSDSTALSTTLHNVMQPTALSIAMRAHGREGTGTVALHGAGGLAGGGQTERSDADADIANGVADEESDVEADTLPVRWFALSGDADAGRDAMATNVVTVPPGRTVYVGAFAGSQEYPDWTGENSPYNDALYWSVKTNRTGNAFFLRKYVNDLHGAFALADAEGRAAHGLGHAVHVGGVFLTAGNTNLPVTLTVAVRNVGDGKRESTGLFGVFPVAIVQSNYPRATGRHGTTDAGGAGTNALIKTEGVAYVTAVPEMAALTARIRGLPEWVETSWSGTLTTERAERGVRDNRTLLATNVLGSASFDITAALTNEVVGGKCVLASRVGENATGEHAFYIRGKNPPDATARAYITAHVDEEFRAYAWKIAKHETLSGLGAAPNGTVTNAMCYNQFNARGQRQELPNLGAPDGWGIGQIDRSGNTPPAMNYTTTREVYDWHENIAAMNNVLRDKRDRYLEIVRFFRNRYQNDPTTHWVEPNVTTNINGVVLSARQWSIMTLYNGAGGCPPLAIPGHAQEQSPIHFDPTTSTWRLYTNRNNYAPKVIVGADATEVD